MNNETRLQALLNTGINNHPDKTALYFQDREYSYLELGRLSRQLAWGLQENGVAQGDRVALFLPNCPEAVLCFLACYRIGAIVVPLNYRYLDEEVRYVLEQTRPKIILFHEERKGIVNSLHDLFTLAGMFILDPQLKEPSYRHVKELFVYPELRQFNVVPGEHPAFILFTSGSTGNPKGVVHSHHGAWHGIKISRQALGFNHEDVVLVGKPICHAGGLQTQLMPVLSVGGQVILVMKPEPADAVALIRQFSVTEYGLLASDLLDFIEYLEEHPESLPSLNNCIGSGDAVPVELHHRFRDLFGWEVLEGCGMTEVGCYYSMNPRYSLHKWGSMGLPCPDTQLRIVNDAGQEVAKGDTGEIEVRSPSATIGYWQDEENTRRLFRDGWLLTGDLAYVDEAGYYWFVGRKKLMIVRRGSNIAPAEVENVIDDCPGIHASVVVGIADKHDGQVPVACVALSQDTQLPTLEELNDYVSARLSAYKCPVHYIFLPELPRNATGKFDRHHLEELARVALSEKQ